MHREPEYQRMVEALDRGHQDIQSLRVELQRVVAAYAGRSQLERLIAEKEERQLALQATARRRYGYGSPELEATIALERAEHERLQRLRVELARARRKEARRRAGCREASA